MSKPNIVYVVDRIAPLYAGRAAEVLLSGLRAVAQADANVTVILRRTSEIDDATLERSGLARRVIPFMVSSDDRKAAVSIYEGAITAARLTYLLLDRPGGMDDRLFAQAAYEIIASKKPDAVCAVEPALSIVELLGQMPAAERPLIATNLMAYEATPQLFRAIETSDVVVTPSKSHIEELTMFDDDWTGLSESMGKIFGIRHGAFDKPRYGRPAVSFPERAVQRQALRAELGLPLVPGVPLLVAPASLEFLREDQLPALGDSGAQIIVTSYHDEETTAKARLLSQASPARVYVANTQALVDRALGCADFALWAENFRSDHSHPLSFMTEGTIPIAPRVGGISEIVVDFHGATRSGTGFLYSPVRGDDLTAAVRRAVRVFRNPEQFAELTERATRSVDLSWKIYGHQIVECFTAGLRSRLAA